VPLYRIDHLLLASGLPACISCYSQSIPDAPPIKLDERQKYPRPNRKPVTSPKSVSHPDSTLQPTNPNTPPDCSLNLAASPKGSLTAELGRSFRLLRTTTPITSAAYHAPRAKEDIRRASQAKGQAVASLKAAMHSADVLKPVRADTTSANICVHPKRSFGPHNLSNRSSCPSCGQAIPNPGIDLLARHGGISNPLSMQNIRNSPPTAKSLGMGSHSDSDPGHETSARTRRMATQQLGGMSNCPGCDIKIGAMELGAIRGPEGSYWHRRCLRCGFSKSDVEVLRGGCGKALDTGAVVGQSDAVYCRLCSVSQGYTADIPAEVLYQLTHRPR
jgi:hypothetical protein